MLEVFGLSDPGCIRANNEDYFAMAEDVGLYIVADGMGGAQAGEHASRMATQFVVDRIRQAPVRDSGLLVESIQQANLALMDAAARNTKFEGMGTTMVAALAPEPVLNGSGGAREIWVASVGDSRAYLCSPGHADAGRVIEITEDQTWVNEVGRRLGMDEDALRTHPMRHVLTMAVGVSQPLRVNVYPVRLESGMQLLLCSDGLHGVVPPRIIAEGLQDDARSLESKCRYLIATAREAGGPDNITVLLLRASGR